MKFDLFLFLLLFKKVFLKLVNGHYNAHPNVVAKYDYDWWYYDMQIGKFWEGIYYNDWQDTFFQLIELNSQALKSL